MSHRGISEIGAPSPMEYSCWTQNKISNPMGIGFGIEYVTWRNIEQWTPPPSSVHWGQGKIFPIL